MALLIDIRHPGWMSDQALYDYLTPHLPGVRLYCGHDGQPRPDVIMLTTTTFDPGVLAALPNLQLIQQLGAGVETVTGHAALPATVKITRLKSTMAAQEMVEYCLAHVLSQQQHAPRYAGDAARGRWRPLPPRQSAQTTVGILGLGYMGTHIAAAFAALGFRLLGWSRSAKTVDGVDCRYGRAQLPGLLAECDYVIGVLPATAQTRGLFDAGLLAKIKPGGRLINIGRGDLIVESDLLAALDSGHLGGAVLDVFEQEPLPPSHPFWRHAKITVTPHVAGWRLNDGLEDVAENYRRLLQGRPLLHQIDRAAGY